MILVKFGEPTEISFNAEDFQVGTSFEGIGGGAAHRASGHDATLKRKVDNQSQTIFEYCMNGKQFGTISINFGRDRSFARQNPTDPFSGAESSPRPGTPTFIFYTMTDARISSYSADRAGGEMISLRFKDLKAAYFTEPSPE
jgi:type VI protein secretion system component Hcp